jgi:hypothetical protein
LLGRIGGDGRGFQIDEQRESFGKGVLQCSVDRGVPTRYVEFGYSTELFRPPKYLLGIRVKLRPSSQRFNSNGLHGGKIDDRLKSRSEMGALKEVVEPFDQWIAHWPERNVSFGGTRIDLRVMDIFDSLRSSLGRVRRRYARTIPRSRRLQCATGVTTRGEFTCGRFRVDLADGAQCVKVFGQRRRVSIAAPRHLSHQVIVSTSELARVQQSALQEPSQTPSFQQRATKHVTLDVLAQEVLSTHL